MRQVEIRYHDIDGIKLIEHGQFVELMSIKDAQIKNYKKMLEKYMRKDYSKPEKMKNRIKDLENAILHLKIKLESRKRHIEGLMQTIREKNEQISVKERGRWASIPCDLIPWELPK